MYDGYAEADGFLIEELFWALLNVEIAQNISVKKVF